VRDGGGSRSQDQEVGAIVRRELNGDWITGFPLRLYFPRIHWDSGGKAAIL
jgi:hypothetical protein